MKILRILVLLFLTTNCKPHEVIGRYESKTSGTIEIKESGEYSLYRTYGNGHVIIPGGESKGEWIIKNNNLLVLNSNYHFNNYGEPIIKIDVEQNRIKEDKISIAFSNIQSYIEIQSRLELEIFLKLRVNEKEINEFQITNNFKSLQIEETVNEYDSVNFDLIFKRKCSECSMPDINNFYIGMFNSNLGHNNFIITLPELTNSSFNYIYMRDEYMLLRKNEIHWNGEVYTKKENGNGTN